MKAYSPSGDVSLANASMPKTVIAVINTASRRAKLKRVIIGSSGAPADAAAKFALKKFSTDGTGSAGTTYQKDSADGAPSCTTKVNYTVEPTYDAGGGIEIALHQRNTIDFDVEAALGGDQLANALGTAKGIGLVCIVAPTTGVNYNATFVWEE